MFKKKKKKDKQGSKITQNTVLVKVYMRFGAEVRQKRAEFTAIETKDGYNNLVAINEDFQFNEDTHFNQNEVYASMLTTLGLTNKQKEESIKTLEEKIEFHTKRIKALSSHPELNKYANIWDEKRKLREYQIFLTYVKNRSENGAYFKIENGIRVYEYESVDGFLIPIWHGVDNLNDFPDFTNDKKITMQETENFKNYLDTKGGKKLVANLFAVMLVVTLVMFIANGYAGFKLYDKHATLDDRILRASGVETCKLETAETYKVFNDLMQNSLIQVYVNETIENKAESPTAKKITDLIPK